MTSPSVQQLLTGIARGTPAGDWLRCYWHAIAISDLCDGVRVDLKLDYPVIFDGQNDTSSGWGQRLGTFTGKPMRVRILGEDLVLFRDGSGQLGLLDLHCPHRRASLSYGRIRDDGIACCYHGWAFDVNGKCIDMPAEPRTSKYKDEIQQRAYAVRELGGMIFAYLGSREPPVLPMLDVIAGTDGVRAVENFGLWPAHWLQIIENSVDPSHTGTLHGSGTLRSDLWNQVPTIGFTPDRFGIQTRQSRGNYDRTGYLRLPSTILINHPWPGGKISHPRFTAIFRTPVDETHTLLFHVTFTPRVRGKLPELPDGVGFHLADFVKTIFEQDYEAIISQGPIYDRTLERLGTSDRGLVLLRKMIREQIEQTQRGEEPANVMRGSEWNRILDSSEKVTDGFMKLEPAEAR